MVQKSVVEKIASPNLVLFVVWLPVLSSDNFSSAEESRALLPDSRVKHFWDNAKKLGEDYRQILSFGEGCKLAWDVYLVYRPGVKWPRSETPPSPDFWMHQLNCMTEERRLDGEALRETIARMLE